MIALILGYKQVYTTIDFLHVPSIPLEERPAYEKTPPLQKLIDENIVSQHAGVTRPGDLDASTVIPIHAVRLEMFKRQGNKWRLHTPLELIMLRDMIISPLTLDATTIFGIRPPELRFVRHQAKYFKWFVREPKSSKAKTVSTAKEFFKDTLKVMYDECPWFDGTGHRVYLRMAAAVDFCNYCDALDTPDFSSGIAQGTIRRFSTRLRSLVLGVNDPRFDGRNNHYLVVFLMDKKEEQLPVIWFNNVRPRNSARFLFHLVLSMGKFDNELALFGTGSLKAAYVLAGLLDPYNLEESIDALLKRYIMEQLMFVPGGTRMFDRSLVQAKRILMEAFSDETVAPEGLPACLYTSLVVQTDEKVKE